MQSAKQILDLAWASRMDGRKDECTLHLRSLRHEIPQLQTTFDQENLDRIPLDENNTLVWDAIILQSSLYRMEGRAKESRELLLAIEARYVSLGLPFPFWLLFEKAMHLYQYGDLSKAMELFNLATHKARSDFEMLCTKSNLVCCLQSLGQNCEPWHSEVRSLLKKFEDNPYTASTRNAHIVIQIYDYLRSGDFNKISNMDVSEIQANQISFLRAWVKQLPYSSSFDSSGDSISEYSKLSVGRYQFGYRQRTLLGILHPDDDMHPRLSDWSDRLYLWVWRWLVNPEANLLQKILTTLQPLMRRDDLYRLNQDDRALVRNALLWLGLFDQASSYALKDLLALIDPGTNSRFALYEIERLIVYYWMSVRDCEPHLSADYLLEIENHPLFSSSELRFSSLINLDEGSETLLTHLQKNLREFSSQQLESQASVILNAGSFEIISKVSDEDVVSEPIYRAFEALKRSSSLSFEEILLICFGISRFRADAHNPKIFNLLSRMKKIAGNLLTIKTKSGRIYAQGNWNAFEFVGIKDNGRQLGQHNKWRDVIFKTQPKFPTTLGSGSFDHPLAALGTMSSETSLTRDYIQSLCGKSRATTGRLLKQWEEKGWIKREGNARATRYFVSSYLKKKLLEGNISL